MAVVVKHKLSAVEVVRLKEPGYYGDGGGLWLQVSPTGTKSWLYRYRDGTKQREMGLGSLLKVGLKEARALAEDANKLRGKGIDPIEHRKAVKAAAALERAREVTFEQAAERYISSHEPSWKNEKHRDQWRSTLKAYVYPVFGSLSVQAVGTAEVLAALEPIWLVKAETASRVRGRIEAILDWARAQGLRVGENPARWRGHLDHLLARRSKVRAVRHHAALPYGEMGAFMADLRGRPGMAAQALAFAIYTGCRTGEVLGAQWTEFDLKARVWTVPAERMKSGKDHKVPLAAPVMDILEGLKPEAPEGCPWVFHGPDMKKPLSNMAMLTLLRRMKREDLTVHGFRSTFRDWAAETTAYAREVVEMALAHTLENKVEAAYRRGDLFEKRRRLMTAWAAYCLKPVRKSGEVVGISA